MVNPALLDQLETAIFLRNRALGKSLLPGLPESEIRSILNAANAEGNVNGLVSLYAWHNGTSDAGVPSYDNAFFPGTSYSFLSLKAAAEHYATLRAAAAALLGFTHDPTKIAEGAGRYFPVFWDSATGYLALDLTPAGNNRAVIIEFEAEEPYRQAYGTFEEFITDAVRVNTENNTLACFRSG